MQSTWHHDTVAKVVIFETSETQDIRDRDRPSCESGMSANDLHLDVQAGNSSSRQQPFVQRDLSRCSVSDTPFSGKSNREQLLGKQASRTALGAIARTTIPLWVRFREAFGNCGGDDAGH